MEQKKYLQLNDIQAYKIAFKLSNYVWQIIIKWDYLAKKTIGAQLVDSVDLISANIAEGFGRFGKKDKIRFYRISNGSVFESLDWNEKSKIRSLISLKEYNYIFQELQKLPREIHHLIKFTIEKLSE